MAHSKCYQIILLGADLPVSELQHVADKTDSQGIVLAGSASLGCKRLFEAVSSLTAVVSIPVFIGGEVSHRCRDDIARANAFPLGNDLSAGLNTINSTIKRSTRHSSVET
jgi:MerR family transcriptional regulator, light-induced transcriptional regulator